MKYVLIGLLLVSCGKNQTLEVYNGTDGKNGHSLVSQSSNLEANLLCPAGGKKLDIYIDLDDTLSVTESDTFNTSLIVCNGSNGEDGIDGEDGADGKDGRRGRRGPRGFQGLVGAKGEKGDTGETGEQGVAGPTGQQGEQGVQGIKGDAGLDGEDGTEVSIVSYTSSSCTNITGTSYHVKTSGSNVSVHTSSSCSGSSKVDQLSDGHSFWFSSSKLGVVIASGGIRVINFN
jgi:hypothetical protein